jgi:hypothetical protein
MAGSLFSILLNSVVFIKVVVMKKHLLIALALLMFAGAALGCPLCQYMHDHPELEGDVVLAQRAIIEAMKASGNKDGAPYPPPPPSGADLLHLDIALTFTPITGQNGRLDGYAAWTLTPSGSTLDTLTLQLGSEHTITRIEQDGSEITYTHGDASDDRLLTIDCDPVLNNGETAIITIWYGGVPYWEDGGGIQIESDQIDMRTQVNQFTPSFFPTYNANDDKFTCTMAWTGSDSFPLILGNGDLIGVTDNGDGTKTTVWDSTHKIANYLIVVGAKPGVEYGILPYSATPDLLLDIYWDGDFAGAYAYFGDVIPPMVAWYEERFGPYGFSRLGQQDFVEGSMEFQTNSGTDWSSSYNYEWLTAHENAHQWFGNLVTCENWHHTWLNEGFAEYCEDQLWPESPDANYNGTPPCAYENFNLIKNLENQFGRYPLVGPDSYFNISYYKGSAVVHMLRWVMADDEDFFNALKKYLADNAYGSALTEDLQAACEYHFDNPDIPYTDLDWFFEQWCYKSHWPEYDWSWWTTGSGSDTILHLQIDQVQTTDDDCPEVFEMPIPFEVEYTDSSTEIIAVWNDQRSQQIDVELDKAVDSIEFNAPPLWWVLCEHEDQTAVEYAEARVASREEGLLVSWETGGDCVGVDVYRKLGIGEELLATSLPSTGSYLDAVTFEGTYDYKLVAHSSDGTSVEFYTGAIDWQTPGEPLALAEPYPNPATDIVTVSFSLPVEGIVELTVYDLAGRRVATLTSENYAAGRHTVEWSVAALPSGIYLLRLEVNGEAITKRAVISR